MSNYTRATALLLFASIAFFPSANAALLLVVDLSVPNTVTINATSGLSSATVSGPDNTGAYFENFYTGNGLGLIDSLGIGNLTNFLDSPDNSPGIYRAGNDPGFNIWTWSAATTVDFTSGVQAFTGSATWGLDPAEYADMLAGPLSGNLYFAADNIADLGAATQIGSWSKSGIAPPIPEPSTYIALAGFAGLGLFVLRRRSKAKATAVASA